MSRRARIPGRPAHRRSQRTRRQTARPRRPCYPVEVEQQIRLFRYIERVSKLTGRDEAWRILEELVTEKRLGWLSRRRIVSAAEPNPIERAFDLFYRQYLAAADDELEIIEKKPDRIVVRCRNPCPTLEACQTLGMDTRFVCRKAYELPTQIFLRRIDPGLRFIRNYHRIRPYAEFCEETIQLAREPERSTRRRTTRPLHGG